MEKQKLHNKALKEVLDDAKDGRLKKKSVEKLKDVVEDKVKPAPKKDDGKVSWIFDGNEYEDLDKLAKANLLRPDEVSYYINRGRINRKG